MEQSRAEAGGQRDGADGPAQAAGAERCSVRREDVASPVPAGGLGMDGQGTYLSSPVCHQCLSLLH